MKAKKKKDIFLSRTGSGKLFLISFLSAAILLTLLFGLYHRYMLSKELAAEQNLPGVIVPQYTAEDNVNFLIIYDPDLTGEHLFAAALCCNAADKTISCCEFNLSFVALSEKKRASLSEHYRFRGAKGIQSGIENLLQARFDFMIRCDQKALDAILNSVGSVTLQKGDLRGLTETGNVNPYYFTEAFADRQNRSILFFRLIESCLASEEKFTKVRNTVFATCDTDLSAYAAVLQEDTLLYLIEKQQFRLLTLTPQTIRMNGTEMTIPSPDELSVLQKAMQ